MAENGQPDPVKKGEYRGLTAYAIDKAKIAALGSWLLITNKDELGKRIIDQYLDGGDRTLSSSENFQRAIASRTDSLSAWSFTDVAAIRVSGTAQALYSGRTDNPLAEILFGGLLANLQHTPFATAEVTVEAQQLKLSLVAPHKAEWIRESREYYFGADNSGQAPSLIELEEGILTVSSYRDLSQMWLRAGDLMTEKANDDLAKADSQLSTFFSGKSFGEDILGSLDPKLQFVVSRQAAEDLKPAPAVRLPAFALVARMCQPEMTQPEFRRVFQSFVGFINVVGAMNGQPQLDLDMSNNDGRQLIAATYVPQPGDLAAKGARINFNFSPSIAFAGSRFIVASTKQLAQTLMVMEDNSPKSVDSAQPAKINPNTFATLEAAWLMQILDDNSGQLVAQKLLEKGRSKEAAAQEIQVLLTLISVVDRMQLELLTSGDTLQLNTVLQLRD